MPKMPKITFRLTLEHDLEAFLRSIQADASIEAISAFINSLLRQESFRQGFPHQLYIKSPSERPISSHTEQIMLRHSGLLPTRPAKYRH